MDHKKLPRHVAIIMDGNGRWAKKQKLQRIRGHEAGIKAVERTVEYCAKTGIQVLTLYAFSSENWQRPALEVMALMKLLRLFLRRETSRLIKNNIRLRAIGHLHRLEPPVFAELEQRMDETSSCTGMVLNLALSYGSRDEMVDAMKRFYQEVETGNTSVPELNPEILNHYLDTAGLPDPDIILRTGGEYRLSNFLLWQAAYAELYFTETLWPDFSETEMENILLDYQHRERRFGMISEQLS
ncbi:MAG: isoprenyl transferase [Deltaproteobacteria bacterium]|nr:isoprenyl transferase [Candidatus Tharpellaceae bacterium]